MSKTLTILVLLASLTLLLVGSVMADREIAPKIKVPEKQTEAQLTTSPAAGEEINWQVISSGGTDGTSASYRLKGTAGQTSTTVGGSASYTLRSGFWQDFATGGVECVPGDADNSGSVDIDDVVYEIAYIFSGGPAPIPDVCCGDADGSGGPTPVDIDDVVYLIAYIFSGGPAPVDAC